MIVHRPTGPIPNPNRPRTPHPVPSVPCSYGATLLSVRTPDREGALAEVTLNLDTVAALLDREKNAYFGSTVGRVANRIAAGRFLLDGKVCGSV